VAYAWFVVKISGITIIVCHSIDMLFFLTSINSLPFIPVYIHYVKVACSILWCFEPVHMFCFSQGGFSVMFVLCSLFCIILIALIYVPETYGITVSLNFNFKF
jgi:hypothetical protein